VEQTVEAASVQFGQAEKLDSKLAMSGPPDGGGLDGDRRTEVGGADQESDAGAGMDRNRARDGAPPGRDVEHRAFANLGVPCGGEIDLQVDGDAGILAAFDHIRLRSGLVRRGLFEEFDGNGVLLHFLHEPDIAHVANDAGKLRPVIAHDAGAVDDHIIDQPIIAGMH